MPNPNDGKLCDACGQGKYKAIVNRKSDRKEDELTGGYRQFFFCKECFLRYKELVPQIQARQDGQKV